MLTKLETIELEGIFGSSIEFDIYALDSVLQPIPCVYIITRFYKDSGGNSQHEIIYIGQTDDIFSRLETHHKWKCFNEYHSNCIGIFQEKDEGKRKLIESTLIKNYDPPCNE